MPPIARFPNRSIHRFARLLGDGKHFGLSLSYKIQPSPDGLAQAFLLGEEFIGGDSCAMILGDNIFYGSGMTGILEKAVQNANEQKATVFGYYVNHPEQFGVMEFDEKWNVLSVEEKPRNPKSHYCITGLYFYPSGVVEQAKKVSPSERGELEITSLNALYLKEQKLRAQILGRGFAWMDTGTMDNLAKAAAFVQIVEQQQGVMVSAPEEIAFRKHWISEQQMLESANLYGKSPYGEHLRRVAAGTFAGPKEQP